MKIPESILIKPTVKLFRGTYYYKIVLRTFAASWFRAENFNKIPERVADPVTSAKFLPFVNGKKYKSTSQDFEYISALYNILHGTTEPHSTRIEYPLLSVYTNSEKLIEELIA